MSKPVSFQPYQIPAEVVLKSIDYAIQTAAAREKFSDKSPDEIIARTGELANRLLAKVYGVSGDE